MIPFTDPQFENPCKILHETVADDARQSDSVADIGPTVAALQRESTTAAVRRATVTL